MSEEEKEYIEHEIVDRLYCLEEKDFDKSKVEDSYIQAVIQAGKENKYLVDKLQKETDNNYLLFIKEKNKYDKLLVLYKKLQKENTELKEKIKEYEIGIVKE